MRNLIKIKFLLICNVHYHVRELQKAANPITTVPITKSTLLKLERSVGGVWFFEASPIAEVAANSELIVKTNILAIGTIKAIKHKNVQIIENSK